jgi:hypothetical protein
VEKIEKPSEDVKTRKATKIMKVQLEKIDQSSLNLDEDVNEPEDELNKPE